MITSVVFPRVSFLSMLFLASSIYGLSVKGGGLLPPIPHCFFGTKNSVKGLGGGRGKKFTEWYFAAFLTCGLFGAFTFDDDGADISWIICILQATIQVFVSAQ